MFYIYIYKLYCILITCIAHYLAVDVLAEEVRVGDYDKGHGQDRLLLVFHHDPEPLQVSVHIPVTVTELLRVTASPATVT